MLRVTLYKNALNIMTSFCVDVKIFSGQNTIYWLCPGSLAYLLARGRLYKKVIKVNYD